MQTPGNIRNCSHKLNLKTPYKSTGFTLIELVIIIVTLGIVAAVAIPKIGSIIEDSKVTATKEEMTRIKQAIAGDARVVAGGKYINRGFEGDVGFPPSNLLDLVQKPDSIQTYNSFTRLGWNGPYLDSAMQYYLYDAWSNMYSYDPAARTITSSSTTPNIVMSF
jgi:type II secretory pathway pseudopilin PulG